MRGSAAAAAAKEQSARPGITARLSTKQVQEEKDGGPRFFGAPQLIQKNLKQDVTEDHLAQVKAHFGKMRAGLEKGLAIELAQPKVDNEKVRKFKCQLWKVNGYLEQGLSLHKLESVVLTY